MTPPVCACGCAIPRSITTTRPVRVIMMQGTINGNRMEMFDSGELIRFERGVTMVVNGDGSNTQARGRTEGP